MYLKLWDIQSLKTHLFYRMSLKLRYILITKPLLFFKCSSGYGTSKTRLEHCVMNSTVTATSVPKPTTISQPHLPTTHLEKVEVIYSSLF